MTTSTFSARGIVDVENRYPAAKILGTAEA